MNALRRLRLAVSLSLIAVLALTFAPSLTRLVAAQGLARGELVEVCTPQGMRFVSTDGTQSPHGDAPASVGSMACPCCSANHGPLVLPDPGSSLHPLLVVRRHAHALPRNDARPRARPVAAAHPRGPPGLS